MPVKSPNPAESPSAVVVLEADAWFGDEQWRRSGPRIAGDQRQWREEPRAETEFGLRR